MTAKFHLVNNTLVIIRAILRHLIPFTVAEFYLANSCVVTSLNKTLVFFKYQA